MFIHSIRYGFACNSSSTHSCVIYTGEENIQEDETKQFGWQYFTVSNQSTIRTYFYTMLKTQIENISWKLLPNLINGIGLDNARIIREQLIALLTPIRVNLWLANEEREGSYVDHQSCYSFPVHLQTKGLVNKDFFFDFIDTVLSTPNFTILGGNDNDEDLHELDDYTEDVQGVVGAILDYLPQDSGCMDIVAIQDSLDFYTLIDRTNGNRLRLSFNDTPITYSSFPQLVDLKITDYCDKGCTFCYQSSTTEGQHGNKYWIEQVINKLAESECLEIALGGGEPTSHPDFIDILKHIKYRGMLANFTTKSIKWLRNSINYQPILDNTNSIAVSVSSGAELNTFLVALEDIGYSPNQINLSVQVVLGAVTKDALKEIKRICHFEHLRLTLLGFKEVGFGETYPKIEYLSWIEEFMFDKKKRVNISIDSALMAEIEPILAKNNVDPKLYTDKEGHFSCYIDACTKTLHKDSYSRTESYLLGKDQWDLKQEKTSIAYNYQQMQLDNGIRS